MAVQDTASGRFVRANDAALALYGYELGEFLSLSLTDLESREAEPHDAAAEAPAGDVGVECRLGLARHRRKDGAEILVELAVQELRHEGDSARLLQISEAGDRQCREIVEALTDGVWMLDIHGRTTYANAALAAMLGKAAPALKGTTLAEHFAQRHRPALQAGLAGELELGPEDDFELQHTPGGARWVRLRVCEVRGDANRRTGTLVVVADATHRRSAQLFESGRSEVRRLIARSAPLQEIFEAIARLLAGEFPGSTCCVLTLRDLGRSLELRAAAGEAAARLHLDDLVVGPDAATPGRSAHLGTQEVVESLRGPGPAESDVGLGLATGFAACWAQPIRNSVGKVLGAIAMFRGSRHLPSPLERMRVEGAAQMTSIALEARQTQEALLESQKMETLGTLASGIAHDFNNILGAILGNLSLLANQPSLDGQGLARVEQAHRAAVRGRDLVQQILAFTRRQPYATVACELRPLIEETVLILKASLPSCVAIRMQMADEALWVACDATRIQQVVMNLCTNAWHALRGDAGSIEIGLARHDPSAGSAAPALPGAAQVAHLWVRDSGIGMDEATRSRIFEPFFTTKPKGRGTGLGLSVVKSIVRDHGGTIDVESAPGRGSTFHLYFALTDAPPAATSERVLAVDPSGRGEHVLCVDDDEVILLTHEALLRNLGYRVTCQPSASAAIDAVRSPAGGTFDVVVADFNMPEMSGVELARVLRGIRPDLPIILGSGLVTDELRSLGQEVGVRALLSKENSAEQLGQLVRSVLSSSPAGRSGPQA